MSLSLTTSSWKSWKGNKQTLVVFALEADSISLLGLERGQSTATVVAWAKEDGFKGKELSSLMVRPHDQHPAERVILVGLGKEKELTMDTLRKAGGKIVKLARSLEIKDLFIRFPESLFASSQFFTAAQAFSEGVVLGAYRYQKQRHTSKETTEAPSNLTLLVDSDGALLQKGMKRGEIYSQATNLVRDLVNEPPSQMNPEFLEREALKARKGHVSVKVFVKKDLEKMGMGGILGVGVGSSVPPRLIELHYKPTGKISKTVALVGKGITFDSGGLSLKPPQNMETMKMDMAGSATVLGIMTVLPLLDLKVEVYGYMAIAENMPSGYATKPGDVLRTYSGKTIEVLNTDAEGRLVLSDALAYAASKKPDMIIDIATLTGACVVALGSSVSGVLSNTPALVKDILAASDKAGEKIWEMPLVKEYREDIKSKVADVKNIGTRRGEAGTIIGGLFLQEFVGDASWAHLDIAGPAWVDSDQPYCPTGATGHPVRTLLHYLESLS